MQDYAPKHKAFQGGVTTFVSDNQKAPGPRFNPLETLMMIRSSEHVKPSCCAIPCGQGANHLEGDRRFDLPNQFIPSEPFSDSFCPPVPKFQLFSLNQARLLKSTTKKN